MTGGTKVWLFFVVVIGIVSGCENKNSGQDTSRNQVVCSADEPCAGSGGTLATDAGGGISGQGASPLGGTQSANTAGNASIGGSPSKDAATDAGTGGAKDAVTNAGTGGVKDAGSGGTVGTGQTAGTSSGAEPCTSGTVDGQRAKELVAQGAILLDVRPASDFAAGSLPGAINIPLADLPNRLDELSKDKTIVTYCQLGIASNTATEMLRNEGFTVCFLGPMSAWDS